jgi:crotonobetainyl-CoA:carnitine CoA-transferase CaiB-like acyl-CoA transferase
VPAGPVRSIDEALESPHAAHRGMVVERDGIRMVGTPIKFSRTPGEVKSPPPRFAEDTRAVLAAHGFDVDEIETLAASGVIRKARRR